MRGKCGSIPKFTLTSFFSLGITNSCQLYRSSPSRASEISEPEVQLVFKIQKVLLYVWPQQKILLKVSGPEVLARDGGPWIWSVQ